MIDADFTPFVSEGSVSLSEKDTNLVRIKILRDTGAKQSFIRAGVLPFFDNTYCGSDVLVWGIKMSVLRVPLHLDQLFSPFMSSSVRVGVRSRLPVPGVDFILGNDMAGGTVFRHQR
ncbi:hypothetical protein LDENG_00020290 [Lucifuga dentata]|nr:hypothetical protein LDENG_00020290 [Lucifuga dentata]